MLFDLLLGMLFTQCPDEPGLYLRNRGIIVVHVDDILVGLKSKVAMNVLFDTQREYVTMERKGRPHVLLGMKILWRSETVKLSVGQAI